MVWGVARAFSGRVLLRIEDHDRTRSRSDFETAILEDLRWLGFVADAPMVRQSDRHALYLEAMEGLQASGHVYACGCSRKSIQAALGPGVDETRYPGTCRNRGVDDATENARRIVLGPTRIVFEDLLLGRTEQVPADQCGDVLARDRHGQWTYQFAAVCDDLDQGIDLVIRGEDLLASAGRQIQLAEMMGRAAPPRFLHHPLIIHPDGSKLSKSNHDTGIRELRAAGWTAERVLGRAGLALGLTAGEPITQSEIATRIREGAS